MAHGLPDWGITAGATTIYRWADRDELAVRLGSPVSYDRRGDVMVVESFEHGDGMLNFSVSGSESVADLSLLRHRTGSFAARLVVGSGGSDFARLERLSTFPAVSALGFEFSFTNHLYMNEVEQDIRITDGANLLLPAVRYRNQQDDLQYRDAAAAWQTFASGINLNDDDHMFHTMKVVVDLATNRYVRVLFGNQAHSLAGIPFWVSAFAVAAAVTQRITGYASGVAPATIYVDDLIMTQNEPD